MYLYILMYEYILFQERYFFLFFFIFLKFSKSMIKYNNVIIMNEEIIDETMETRMFYKDVKDITNEWEELINELSNKEVDYLQIKDRIFDKQQWMEENTNFKEMYGKNNADVRKAHFKKFLKDEYAIRNHLEVSIDYLQRRISFLKAMTYVKMGMIDI